VRVGGVEIRGEARGGERGCAKKKVSKCIAPIHKPKNPSADYADYTD
jgi:hypothetical protein